MTQNWKRRTSRAWARQGGLHGTGRGQSTVATGPPLNGTDTEWDSAELCVSRPQTLMRYTHTPRRQEMSRNWLNASINPGAQPRTAEHKLALCSTWLKKMWQLPAWSSCDGKVKEIPTLRWLDLRKRSQRSTFFYSEMRTSLTGWWSPVL